MCFKTVLSFMRDRERELLGTRISEVIEVVEVGNMLVPLESIFYPTSIYLNFLNL